MYSEPMNVLITGANGGLGTAVCQEFLAAGAKVIGVAREWKQSAPFTTISADVTTEAGCDSMVKQALEHGPIDALVHLVGGFAGGSPVSETTDQTWDRMMNLNLRAAFCCIRAALKPMHAAGRGRIVAIGTRMAVEPSPQLRSLRSIESGASGASQERRRRRPEIRRNRQRGPAITIDTPANRAAMPKADFSRWVRRNRSRSCWYF